jgi:hypothetical protein
MLATCLIMCACDAPPSRNTRAPESPSQAPAELVGKVWLSTDPSASPGTLRIFLPDGTLVMDSCFETYRLARWQALDNRRIEWHEDTARIEAEITSLSAERLQLRLRLVGESKEEAYRPAQIPFVCPDLPR